MVAALRRWLKDSEGKVPPVDTSLGTQELQRRKQRVQVGRGSWRSCCENAGVGNKSQGRCPGGALCPQRCFPAGLQHPVCGHLPVCRGGAEQWSSRIQHISLPSSPCIVRDLGFVAMCFSSVDIKGSLKSRHIPETQTVPGPQWGSCSIPVGWHEGSVGWVWSAVGAATDRSLCPHTGAAGGVVREGPAGGGAQPQGDPPGEPDCGDHSP